MRTEMHVVLNPTLLLSDVTKIGIWWQIEIKLTSIKFAKIRLVFLELVDAGEDRQT
jgi:hypothetical protein